MRRRVALVLLLFGLLLCSGAPAVFAVADPVPALGVAVATGAPPLPLDVTATSFLVADLNTGEIWAAKDEHRRLLPASTLKVLTALALIPRVARDTVVVPTVDDVEADGTRVGIIENDSYPAYQLFRAMLMTSGNDAANALARAAGGRSEVARFMNDAARRAGALDTVADNPSGLDAPGQTTTAYDLALIARAAMRLPDFRAYVATKRSSINGRRGRPLFIASHDKLLYNYPGAIGIKNGYTVKAGATFIGAATRGGHTLLVTVLHARARVWPEVAHLLDWGFAAESAAAGPLGRLPDPPAVRSPLQVRAGTAPRQLLAQRGTGTSSPRPPLTVAAGVAALAALAVARHRFRSRHRPARPSRNAT